MDIDKGNEELKPIYRYEYNPETRTIKKYTIKDYTIGWNGKRISYPDRNTPRVLKRLYLKDFDVFSYGRIFTYNDDIKEVKAIAIKGLLERIEKYEETIKRLKEYIKALDTYEE